MSRVQARYFVVQARCIVVQRVLKRGPRWYTASRRLGDDRPEIGFERSKTVVADDLGLLGDHGRPLGWCFREVPPGWPCTIPGFGPRQAGRAVSASPPGVETRSTPGRSRVTHFMALLVCSL